MKTGIHNISFTFSSLKGRWGVFFLLMLAALGIRAQATFDYFYLEAEKCRLAEDYSSAMDLYRHCLDINP